ncbi:hypothetical protein BT69DRAFT_1275571, partial [Atractiella rhizophila]
MSCSPRPSAISSTSPNHSCQTTSVRSTENAGEHSPHHVNLTHAIDSLPLPGGTNLHPTSSQFPSQRGVVNGVIASRIIM